MPAFCSSSKMVVTVRGVSGGARGCACPAEVAAKRYMRLIWVRSMTGENHRSEGAKLEAAVAAQDLAVPRRVNGGQPRRRQIQITPLDLDAAPDERAASSPPAVATVRSEEHTSETPV